MALLAGVCLLKGPTVLYFLRRQQHKAEPPSLFWVPAMAATASASWCHPGGKDKGMWKVLVIMALLQAQLPGTGKAGQMDGKELPETLLADRKSTRLNSSH